MQTQYKLLDRYKNCSVRVCYRFFSRSGKLRTFLLLLIWVWSVFLKYLSQYLYTLFSNEERYAVCTYLKELPLNSASLLCWKTGFNEPNRIMWAHRTKRRIMAKRLQQTFNYLLQYAGATCSVRRNPHRDNLLHQLWSFSPDFSQLVI